MIRSFDFPCRFAFVCGLAAAALVPAGGASAKGFHVVYTFQTSKDGDDPQAGLIRDAQGDLYGTSFSGGVSRYGNGTVFRLAPDGTETVLHSFSDGADGEYPGGPLIMDGAGNLYGVTEEGGLSDGCNSFGCGVVFEMAPDGEETELYTFSGGTDGAFPYGALLADGKGDFYGTTNGGGAEKWGTVFEVSPGGKETVLHSFASGSDGNGPQAGLVADKSGNMYGTTKQGGGGCSGFGCGTVFEVAPDGTEHVLYAFTGGADGGDPIASLIRDKAGNLYGTTEFGGDESGCGASGCGTVFKLAPGGALTVLYTFTGGNDGGQPVAALVRDKDHNFYGTTLFGGAPGGYGVVFKLAPDGKEHVLHTFTNGADGAYPWAALLDDGNGGFLSTAAGGGATDFGTVFKLKK
ncbi:MAG TPA: choice-of-anchor tandem repeat GloVer-containing protein [Rhizomicrobium sp.]